MSFSAVEVEPTAPSRRKMAIAEFQALPEDGTERMLIDGELWELGMTPRAHVHGEVAASISNCLYNWNKTQPRPRGKVSVGDVGYLLPGEEEGEDSALGPDVGFASPDLVARSPKTVRSYPGAPVLAVEVLSLSDTQDSIIAKISKFLQAGAVVWEVDPVFETVRVHRPNLPIQLLDATGELDADPYLPGFRVAVASFFDD